MDFLLMRAGATLIAPMIAPLTAAMMLAACATAAPAEENSVYSARPEAAPRKDKFNADRAAILAMAGDYHVKFDFTETVSFEAGYEPKEPYVTGGDEVVRVIEDRGDFISLQHILVVGGDEKMAIKHWRQDWTYEPASVLEYVGGAAWTKRALSPAERKGKWSQVVYQVDDAPRYGAVAEWRHENGVSEWTSPPNMRPLPRRDATKRDDYQAILAVNRHAITPQGWVHEQDNSKLVLEGSPHILVREVGVNTYARGSDFAVAVAEDYWAKTKDFWAGVRAEWTKLETENKTFALTIQGEPTALYNPMLEIAEQVQEGEEEIAPALDEARALIAKFTTTAPGALADRLAAAEPLQKRE